MGHYRSEMCCQTCGGIPCECPCEGCGEVNRCRCPCKYCGQENPSDWHFTACTERTKALAKAWAEYRKKAK